MLRHLFRTVNLFDTAQSALFLCFLAACRGQTGGGDQAGRGLVYYETYDPRSLDPALSTDVPTGEMVTLLLIAGAGDFADGRARDVSGIAVLGDTAVAFTLTEPLAIFPKFLAMPVASVAPSPVPAEFGQRPVGTGPWRFVTWEHDDYLRFARNPSYWGGASLSESLTVRIIPEALTRAAEFLAGRISVVEVPFGETKKWEQEHP